MKKSELVSFIILADDDADIRVVRSSEPISKHNEISHVLVEKTVNAASGGSVDGCGPIYLVIGD